nr:hypothetical protein [Microcystis sp. LEGE 00066]
MSFSIRVPSLITPVYCIRQTEEPLLASGGDDKSLKLWDLKAGKAIISIPHPQKIYSVCFSPDGHYIATACQDKIVRVYGTSELQSLAS